MKIHYNQTRSLTLDYPTTTYGGLNALIDKSLKEVILWCAKSTKDDSKERYVFSQRDVDFIINNLSTEDLSRINITPLEEDGEVWCWMLTRKRKNS